jgi:hypothetical protein
MMVKTMENIKLIRIINTVFFIFKAVDTRDTNFEIQKQFLNTDFSTSFFDIAKSMVWIAISIIISFLISSL